MDRHPGVRAARPSPVQVVCRANRARSPFVAAFWAKRLLKGGFTVDLRSSGIHADPGHPILPAMSRALETLHEDVPVTTSRRFDDQALNDPGGLVVTFERRLQSAILERRPELVSRCFTLREIIRLSDHPGWDAEVAGTPDVVPALHRRRPIVPAGNDDTPDPAALPDAQIVETVRLLREDAARAATVLWGV